MFAGKKGQEEVLSEIVQLVIVILILSAVIYFIHLTTSGKLIEDQMSAKQIALMLDSAKPGTSITISTESELEIKEYDVKVKSDNIPYEYGFNSPHEISLKKIDGGYIINIA